MRLWDLRLGFSTLSAIATTAHKPCCRCPLLNHSPPPWLVVRAVTRDLCGDADDDDDDDNDDNDGDDGDDGDDDDGAVTVLMVMMMMMMMMMMMRRSADPAGILSNGRDHSRPLATTYVVV
eukprot:2794083-Amphidinium_carterae.4